MHSKFAAQHSVRPSFGTPSFALIAMSAATLLVAAAASAQGLSERIRAVADQKMEAAKNDTSKGRLLGSLLYSDLSVNFDKTDARTAFGYIRDQIGVPLVVRYAGEGASEGIDPELEINLQMENVPALTVIERLLEICGTDTACTWQLREGFIEVGTKGRLAAPAAREVRMYPVRDLLFEPPMFDNAPQFNLGAALQQGQGGQGGGGGGMGGGGGGGGFGGGGGGFGGGGGGFGGGGGGSGGSGGGGGGLIGEPGEDPERPSEEEKANQLQDLIKEQCEPEAWDVEGWATMRYYQGVLIIRAPDFVHRQIDGYPFAPVRPRKAADAGTKRYVTFSGEVSIVQNLGFDSATVTGAAGGNNTTGSPIAKPDADTAKPDAPRSSDKPAN